MLGAPLRTGHRAAIGAQLLGARLTDRRVAAPPGAAEREEVAEHVTLAVKTFLRPQVCRRLVRSVRGVFDGRIVVADDSPEPLTADRLGEGVDVLALPANSGVSRGRNAAVDAVETEFTFICDDDLVATTGLRLGRMMRYLRDQPGVDIVGAALIELPRRYTIEHGPGGLFGGAAEPLLPYDTDVGGLPVRHKIAQVFLARTAALREVRWDEGVRMVDHRDFFSEASGRLLTVLDHQSWLYHARTPFDATYTAYRSDVADDLRYLQAKWAARRTG